MADQIPTTFFNTFTCIVESAADAPIGQEFVGVSHRGKMICLTLCTTDGQMLTCGLGADTWNKLMMATSKHIMAIGGGQVIYDAEASAPPTIN